MDAAQEVAPIAAETNDVPGTDAVGEVSQGSANAPAAVKAEPEVKKYKVTIDGESAELTDEDIQTMYKNAARGISMEDQIRGFIENSRKDPDFFFSQLGIDPTEYAEKLILKNLRESTMTPEEKALEEERRELEALRNEKKKAKELEEQKRAEALAAQAETEIDVAIKKVFDESNIKYSVTNTAKVAEILYAYLQDANTVLDENLVRKAVKHFNKSLRQDINMLSQDLTDEELVDMIGQERFNKLLKFDLQKANKNVPNFAPKGLSAEEGKTSKKKPTSIDDFLKTKGFK